MTSGRTTVTWLLAGDPATVRGLSHQPHAAASQAPWDGRRRPYRRVRRPRDGGVLGSRWRLLRRRCLIPEALAHGFAQGQGRDA